MPCKWSFDSASAYCGQEGLWFFSRETRNKDLLCDISVFIVPIFAWNVSLGISNFLEEIFSLSHSVVFLYFFALITEKGFLISPCYSLELCVQMGISFLFCLVKALVFPVVVYGCESWAIKKVECWRIDAFELWCWRVPWTPSRSNQSILKEISPEYSLKGLTLKLNSNILTTWCEELTHGKRPWCWERLKAGGEGDNRGWDGWMASPTQRTWVGVNSWS